MAKKYDGIYIFAGATKDEALDKLVDRMKGEITRLGGAVLGTDVAGRRNFARPMQKRDHGVYVRIRFEIDPAQIATLRDRYHLIEDLFRLQIVAVDERREALVAEQTAKRRAREAYAAAHAETAPAPAEA